MTPGHDAAAASRAELPLAELIPAHDWAATPIGPEESWPQSLRTALGICLESRFPILIWWGPEHVMLYNDAYAPVIGAKHPDALGQRGAECFPEIWDIIGPMLAGVLERGESTWSDDQLLLLDRSGYPEECYFTFSYSPIRDESGGIAGVFTAVAETTSHVIGARRLGILHELAAATADARTVDDACARAADVLRGSISVAFSLTYLFDGDASSARLVASSDLPDGARPGSWPLDTVAAGAEAVLVEETEPDLPARRAIVLPLAHGTGDASGAVVLGFNPHRGVDDDYLAFMRLVARQIAAAVSDAQAYEQERRRADALAELDRAKTLFFTNVSHELRTPLTLILSPVEDMLAGPEPAPAELRDQLGLVRRNALRLLRLVNTLLDFSRAESGRIDALFQPTDLAATTADLASSFRSAIEVAGLRFAVDCAPLEEPVWVDREAWEKIVLNLLSNALKFTFEGEIGVALRIDGDAAVLEVRDTGVGIPEDELPHLFERFHRVRGARARTHEGSGVGLALVRELAELHGGAVGVESAPAAGTTFNVRVPLGSAHLPADRVGGPEGTGARGLGAAPYVEEALRWLPEDTELPAAADEPGLRDDLVRDTGVSRSGDALVLVVDDNADMRGYVARLLRRYWRVETAPDGTAALEAARRERPDLVLSDVMMPGLDGFELLRELRSDPATTGVPVVLLSARAGAESAVEGLEAGADDYLVKPFSARELVARVRANLELSRLRVDLAQLEAAAEERGRAERVLMRLPDGVLVVGGTGAVELWNAGAERITGRKADQVVGRLASEVLPGFDELAARVAGRHGRTTTYPLELDGRELWLSVVAAPYPDGRLYGFRDVTEAAVLEQLRTDLVTTISHELRTPVSSIYGAAATLARTDIALDEETRRRLFDALHEQTQRLARIVEELATVAALDEGSREGERRPCDVCTVAARAFERAELRRPDGVALRIRLPERELLLELVEEQLEQVLDALLDNALRFTPAGEVELSVEPGGEVVRIAVRDTGIGIAPEHHARIGEKFYRVDPQLQGGVAGLGLGLYVCRRLLWLMGGRLAFESVEGAGSTFVAELPATR